VKILLGKRDLRSLGIDVAGGLVVTAILALLGLLSDIEIPLVIWIMGAIATTAVGSALVAFLRVRRAVREALEEKDELHEKAKRFLDEAVKAQAQAEEANRRAEAAEGRTVAADNRATDYETSAQMARAELEKANAVLAELRRWENLEAHTGLCDYWRRLDASEERPRERLDRIHRSLDFMGHGASKWTGEREKFAEMVNRLADNNFGQVRMLLLNPDCESSREKSKRRFNGDARRLPRRIVQSLLILRQMQQIYGNLSVKLYTHVPHFRLTVVDGQTVIVGHYREGKDDSARTPLIAWEKNSDWSFFTPFEGYFAHEWHLAEEVDWPAIEGLSDELAGSTV
jgi:hypothetical protein